MNTCGFTQNMEYTTWQSMKIPVSLNYCENTEKCFKNIDIVANLHELEAIYTSLMCKHK